VAPVQSGTLSLDLPADWKNHDALVVTATNPAGKEVYRRVWNIRSNEQLLATVISTNKDSVIATETDTTLSLRSAGITVAFSKKNGQLIGVNNTSSNVLHYFATALYW
jgi:hypothetical protein